MGTVDKLMEEAFRGPREPRSDEYKAGVRAALEFRIDGKKPALPYPIGTAQADAFFAGVDDGHRIWNVAQIQTDTYVELLKRHDWQYDRSDDGKAWRRGQDERNELIRLQAEVDADFALWNAHAPEQFRRR